MIWKDCGGVSARTLGCLDASTDHVSTCQPRRRSAMSAAGPRLPLSTVQSDSEIQMGCFPLVTGLSQGSESAGGTAGLPALEMSHA